jgi:hypothetical protein
MKKIKYLILAASIILPVAGCTNMSKTQQGTLSGGAIGAGAGLGIAAISGGNLWVGTAKAGRGSQAVHGPGKKILGAGCSVQDRERASLKKRRATGIR